MELQQFNADYVRRLTEGDRFVEDHFTAYFGELLYLKLRCRLQSPQAIDEIRQETYVRVFQTLREKGGLEHPERLGAFVNSVCNHVLLEGARNGARHKQLSPANEWVDRRIDLDSPLIDQDRKRLVASVLAELPKRDGELLRLVFLEEVSKAEACQRLGVGEDYFRVLLHRAISRFRKQAGKAGWRLHLTFCLGG